MALMILSYLYKIGLPRWRRGSQEGKCCSCLFEEKRLWRSLYDVKMGQLPIAK